MGQNYKIKKVLIANRAEIALRIQRACKSLGISTLSIASEADKSSLHARLADELVIIGPAPARDSYLAIDKIVQTAVKHGCDAVHPGYGFLSENAEFAAAVTAAGLKFVGPSAECIAGLGSKTSAREQVVKRGVSVTPGTPGNLTDPDIVKAAKQIGFPVIVKAVAGGGGRGMRVVNSTEELESALPRARAEAQKNFSNPAVFIEKYISQPRHVEVQIFGDSYGNLVHFGTRDCSTQRRHQKLIEEAPAPNLSPALRAKIENSAIEAARSFNYVNAGTAEFLVKDGECYFLEMNTRIQVEHPVTEAITGIDLVALQLKIAAGEKLPLKQADVNFNGHAIEFRIYAEDPAQNFAPDKGRILSLKRPQGEGLREDSGFEENDTVSLHYDALLSKLIVHADTRTDALNLAYRALRDYTIKGIATTLPFHRWMLRCTDFVDQPIDIGFLDREFKASSIHELEVGELKDPLHVGGMAEGLATVENIQYLSRRFNVHYKIQVIHESDGTFLVRPENATGALAQPQYCRRSNGRNTALTSLVNEVLEKIEPIKLF